MSQSLILSVIVLLSVSIESGQGIGRHDRPDELYLELATRAEFAPVVALESNGEFLGSAVLISPKWLITAKHIVAVSDESTISTRFGNTEAVVHRIERHQSEDLALLELSSPIESVSPASLVKEQVAIGTEVVSVGYGLGGKGDDLFQTIMDATQADAGIKRAGMNTVDQLEDGKILQADFDHPTDDRYNMTGASDALDLEYLPMSGDSGGGLFSLIDGNWHLVGVTLAATSGRDVDEVGDYGKAVLYGWVGQWHSVFSERDWIQSYVGK